MRRTRRAGARAALVEPVRDALDAARREIGAQVAEAVARIEERERADAERYRQATRTAASIMAGARVQRAARDAQLAASVARLASVCDDLVSHLELSAARDDLAALLHDLTPSLRAPHAQRHRAPQRVMTGIIRGAVARMQPVAVPSTSDASGDASGDDRAAPGAGPAPVPAGWHGESGGWAVGRAHPDWSGLA